MDPVADQRVVRGAAATLEAFVVDQDGEPVTTAGPGNVTITRGNGVVLIDNASVAADATTAGRFTYDLAAADNQILDLLTAVWTVGATSITTLVDVAGGVYFTVGAARAAIDTLTEVKYSTGKVLSARHAVEIEFERICDRAFVPRYRRRVIDTRGRCTVFLPGQIIRSVRSVTAPGISFDDEQLAEIVISESGGISIPIGRFPSYKWTVFEYEHGHDRPPRDIRDVAFTRLRETLNSDSSGIPARATSFQFEGGGGYRLDQADVDKTGNPAIDAVLARYPKPLLVA